MPLQSLQDVYIHQLQDIHSADKQSRETTQRLRDAATSDALCKALQSGVDGIGDGIDTVAGLIKSHLSDPGAEHSKGMEGLVRDAQAHVLDRAIFDPVVRDAMIIAQFQRMTHYGLATYGCALAFARQLGLDADAAQLETCLNNTEKGRSDMMALASGAITRKAA